MDFTHIPVSKLIGITLISEVEKVRFSFCDMQSHMNAAKFVQVALDHRYETVDRILGISFKALKSTKSHFVLGSMKATYQRQLQPHQLFYSVNWTSHQTGTATWVRSILFTQRKSRYIIHSTFEFEVIQVDTRGKAIPILSMPSEKSPKDLQQTLETLEKSSELCKKKFNRSENSIFQP